MRKAVAGLAILACWAVSLLVPAVDTATSSGANAPTGWDIAMIGWLGPLTGQFGWFANLLLIPAIGLAAGQYGRAPRARLIIGSVMLILALNSALWVDIPLDSGRDEITSYRIGYWLWMAAISSCGLWLVGSGHRQAARRAE